jgi:hypothetical protein
MLKFPVIEPSAPTLVTTTWPPDPPPVISPRISRSDIDRIRLPPPALFWTQNCR